MSSRVSISAVSVAGLMVFLSGCATGGGSLSSGATTSTTGALATGGAANVYALNDVSSTSALTSNSMLEYSAASTGSNSVPSVTLPLSTLAPSGAALDGSGLLYISGADDVTGLPLVNVYAAGATSTSAPIRSFSPNAAYQPISIAVSTTGQAYVLEGYYDAYGDVLATQVEVFAAGATATAAPTAIISGTATQMIDPQDIAVDTTGNIYVANDEDTGSSQVLVFAAGANGGVAPTSSITFTGDITGVAVDSTANMYVAVVSSTGAGSIAEYAAGGTGSPTATKTISGSTSGLSAAYTGGVRVDAAGNIWLIEQSPDTATNPATYVAAWGPSATGNVAPAVEFAPPALLNPNAAFAVR